MEKHRAPCDYPGQTEAAKRLLRAAVISTSAVQRMGNGIDMAEGRGRTEIAALLREKGAKKSSGLPAIK